MSQPKDRREELCERFAEALRHPADEIYFDEDELVEIYDYAGDLGKIYLQTEALMCGARLYPTSRALSDRRALFYVNNCGADAAAQYIEDHTDDAGPRSLLSEIVAIKTSKPDDEGEVEQALDSLLESVTAMNDEEVVQFVDLAGECGMAEWLLDKLDELRTKVPYLPTLLYETAMVLSEAGMDGRAVPIIEELIEIDDAYSVDYWNMLAQSKLESGDYYGAMNAIEYARAIDPGNYGAITLYVRVCFESDDPNYAKEGYDFTSRYLETDPANDAMRQAFVSFGLKLGKVSEVAPSVRQLYLANSTSRDHLLQLLSVGVPLEGELADVIVASFGETDDTWPMMLRHLCNNGRYAEVVTLGNKYIESYGFPSLDIGPYTFSLFALKLFSKCVDKLSVLVLSDDCGNIYRVLYLVALLKTGRQQMAMSMMSVWRDVVKLDTVRPESKSDAYLLLRVMGEVSDIISSDADHDWSDYDPLKIWSRPSADALADN